MGLVSSSILAVSRIMPRGYWPMMRLAARIDPSLSDYPLPITAAPGIRLRADLGQSVFVSIFREGCIPHQRGFDTVCRKLVKPNDTVFDVGANIGYTTAMYSTLVGGLGRVVSVEPSPPSFGLLSRSLSGIENVTLVNKGLSNSVGNLEFYIPQSLDVASFTPIPGATVVNVPVTTGDELVGHFGSPQLVKVDTEGHELKVFEGFSKTFASDDRPIVLFEALGPREMHASISALQATSSGGYRFHRIGNDGSLIDLDDKTGTNDFVAVPNWALGRL